jgi:predicted O-linked N-acetylglucosamine transferase (SPINDLY family)
MGIESLTATNAEDYAAIAVRLGTEPDYRRAMSDQIVQNSGLIFSPEDTLRDYERFFESIVAPK